MKKLLLSLMALVLIAGLHSYDGQLLQISAEEDAPVETPVPTPEPTEDPYGVCPAIIICPEACWD